MDAAIRGRLTHADGPINLPYRQHIEGILMNDLLARFDSVRIINLPERTDRRREMTQELERIGATGNPRIAFSMR